MVVGGGGGETRRRLAAILALDVVGSSRLMEADEPGTLAAMVLKRNLIPATDRHHGRVVKVDFRGLQTGSQRAVL